MMQLYGIASAISGDIETSPRHATMRSGHWPKILRDEPSLVGLLWVEAVDLFDPCNS
jgi:hypothetical protein